MLKDTHFNISCWYPPASLLILLVFFPAAVLSAEQSVAVLSPAEHDSVVSPTTTSKKIDDVKVYPNPFSLQSDKKITIQYILGDSASVDLRIYTPSGELIWQDEGNRSEGPYHVQWNGTNILGETVVFGGYVCKILVTPSFGGNATSKTVTIGILP